MKSLFGFLGKLTDNIFGLIVCILFFPVILAIIILCAAVYLVALPFICCAGLLGANIDAANKASPADIELMNKLATLSEEEIAQITAKLPLDDKKMSKASDILAKLKTLSVNNDSEHPLSKKEALQIGKELNKELKTLKADIKGGFSKEELKQLKKSLLSQVNNIDTATKTNKARFHVANDAAPKEEVKHGHKTRRRHH